MPSKWFYKQYTFIYLQHMFFGRHLKQEVSCSFVSIFHTHKHKPPHPPTYPPLPLPCPCRLDLFDKVLSADPPIVRANGDIVKCMEEVHQGFQVCVFWGGHSMAVLGVWHNVVCVVWAGGRWHSDICFVLGGHPASCYAAHDMWLASCPASAT